jgi:hypothetical protein
VTSMPPSSMSLRARPLLPSMHSRDKALSRSTTSRLSRGKPTKA